MFLWKLIFQNVAKYLTQNFVNKTKSVWPEGKAETYFSFFPYKNEKNYYGVCENHTFRAFCILWK